MTFRAIAGWDLGPWTLPDWSRGRVQTENTAHHHHHHHHRRRRRRHRHHHRHRHRHRHRHY